MNLPSKEYDYVMVGAGLYNATLASLLADRGFTCLVVERRKEIGGNCHTSVMNGITVHDYGAHIFHTSDEEVWEFATRHGKFNQFVNSPIARVKISPELRKQLCVPEEQEYLYLNLPFNMNTFSKLFPEVPVDEMEDYIKKLADKEGGRGLGTIDHVARTMVGSLIFETLVKEYTEKQWGRPCTELPGSIIRRLPLRFTWDNNYFNDTYQGIPVDGYTNWIGHMLSHPNITVVTGCDFLQHRDELSAMAGRKVFYSGRLDELFGYKHGELPFRSLKFETLYRGDTDNAQGVAVMNYTTHDVPYTRTIEHRHFVKTAAPGTVITYEYPQEATRDNEPYYPVDSQESRQLYREYLSELGDGVITTGRLIPTGRLGMYMYFDMDKCIRAAMDLVNSIV